MSEPLSLDRVADLAAQLPPAEQRRLAETLLGGAPAGNGAPGRRRWRDIRGAAAHPPYGRNAQEWVSESRQEDESHRQPPGSSPP